MSNAIDTNDNHAVLILATNDYPKELYSFVADDMASTLLGVKIVERKNGVMAMIEWAIPTLVIAYLLKPFFESFLQEAGKDAYNTTKATIKKLVKNNLPMETVKITASSSPEKLSERYDQSGAISLKVAVHSKLTFTVLFNKDMGAEELDVMLDGLFTSIEQMYIEIQKEFPEEAEENIVTKNELYLIANLENKSWEILTTNQMLNKYRKK